MIRHDRNTQCLLNVGKSQAKVVTLHNTRNCRFKVFEFLNYNQNEKYHAL